MEIQEINSEKQSLYYFYKLFNKNVIRSFYKFSENFDRQAVIKEKFPPAHEIDDIWELYWRIKSMSYKEMVSKFEIIFTFVLARLVSYDDDQSVANSAQAPLSKIFKWSLKRILRRNFKKFHSDGDLDLIIEAGQKVVWNLINTKLFSQLARSLGIQAFLLLFLKKADYEGTGFNENDFWNDLNEFNLISVLRLIVNNINDLLMIRDLRNIVFIMTFAKQFEFLTNVIKQFKINPDPPESSVLLIKDILIFVIRNMCPNDFFLQPSLLGKEKIISSFFKELSLFLMVHGTFIYKYLDFETCDIISCLCSLLLFLMKNKSKIKNELLFLEIAHPFIKVIMNNNTNLIDLDDNVNAILKSAKLRLEKDYPAKWPLNDVISEEAYQAKWRRIFKFLYFCGKNLTPFMNERNFYFWMSSIDLIKKNNSLSGPEFLIPKEPPLNTLIITAFKQDFSFKDLNKIVSLIMSTECPRALLFEFLKYLSLRNQYDLIEGETFRQAKYITEIFSERLRHAPNPALAKFLIHFVLSLPDEYINEIPKLTNLFTDLVSTFQNNFSFIISSIAFEAKRLHKILKTPDLYGGLIDGIGKNFLKLFENMDEYSKNVMNIARGREVEVALFSEAILLYQKFLQIPVMFTDSKHQYHCKKQKSKKTHFLLVHFPYFCTYCGKHLKSYTNSYPNKEKHLFIICRVCANIIEPYYFKSVDSHIAISKSLKEKARTWENEIRRAVGLAIDKKKDRLLKIRNEKTSLNNLQLIENYFSSQEFTFLACLENILRIYQ